MEEPEPEEAKVEVKVEEAEPRGKKGTTRRSKNYRFKGDQMQKFMKPFILSAYDVKGDGHCGFRSLAVVSGYSEEDYLIVRRELATELLMRKDLYARVSIFC